MNNNATSFSDIQTAQRCLYKYKCREVLRIQPIRRSVTMHEGSLQHGMLQDGYIAIQQGNDPIEAAIAWANAHVNEQFLFDDELAEQEKMIDVALTRTVNYFDNYADDDWEILHVEEQFIFMLEDGTVVSCTPDLVVRERSNGTVWVLDHKTYQTVPKSSPVDLQATLATAAVRAIYPETAGFFYNFLRKKLPTEPTLVKSGKNVSRINDIDTTFEMLRDFLTNEAPHLMDDDAHRRRLAELSQENRFFRRNPVYLDDASLANALEDITSQVKIMDFSIENELFPRTVRTMGMDACDRCGFYQICQAELVDSDPERVLAEFYEPRDDSHKQYEEEA